MDMVEAERITLNMLPSVEAFISCREAFIHGVKHFLRGGNF